MEREHNIVDHIFRNDMKRNDHSCNNINTHISPMSMFNGDLMLISRNPSGGIYVLLGDFTGHGLSAAIGCLPTSDIFYAMAEKQESVGDIATAINDRLINLLPDYMFFCATLIEISPQGDRLSIWAGGMNEIILIDTCGKIEARIQSQHMPLGVLEPNEFDSGIQVSEPKLNTMVFIYTDGVIETVNPAGELYGEERLEKVLLQNVENMINAVVADCEAFREDEEPNDDSSMVEIRCAPISYRE